MLSDLISLAVALGGGGMIALAIKQARSKGWAGSLQMAAGGFLLLGATAIGVVGFLADIVFNPLAWLGVVALGIAAALFTVGQRLEGRARGRTKVEQPDESAPTKFDRGSGGSSKAVEGRKPAQGVDDDVAEIEDILRRHGIE